MNLVGCVLLQYKNFVERGQSAEKYIIIKYCILNLKPIFFWMMEYTYYIMFKFFVDFLEIFCSALGTLHGYFNGGLSVIIYF